jgi:hypothetical protein
VVRPLPRPTPRCRRRLSPDGVIYLQTHYSLLLFTLLRAHGCDSSAILRHPLERVMPGWRWRHPGSPIELAAEICFPDPYDAPPT